MLTIQRAAMLGIMVVGSMSAEASHAVAQYVARTTSPSKVVSPSVVYHRYDWVVDMRRGDGDPRRYTCLSGVFARDGAYYPFHDHIDDGSLRHVDRFFCDGRGGYYHQRGFIWMSHGKYREGTNWSHYRRITLRRSWRAGTGIAPSSKGRAKETLVGGSVPLWPVSLHEGIFKPGLQQWRGSH